MLARAQEQNGSGSCPLATEELLAGIGQLRRLQLVWCSQGHSSRSRSKSRSRSGNGNSSGSKSRSWSQSRSRSGSRSGSGSGRSGSGSGNSSSSSSIGPLAAEELLAGVGQLRRPRLAWHGVIVDDTGKVLARLATTALVQALLAREARASEQQRQRQQEREQERQQEQEQEPEQQQRQRQRRPAPETSGRTQKQRVVASS